MTVGVGRVLSEKEKQMMHNKSQGYNPRYLVVCNYGILLSPTIMKVMYEQCSTTPNIRCAGLDPLALTGVSERLIEWADFVICCNKSQCVNIQKGRNFKGKIYNFSLNDKYDYLDCQLQQIVKDRLKNMEQWEY